MNPRTIILLLVLGALLGGCAVAGPAFQIVGAAKTTYDIHEMVRPPDRVDFGAAQPADNVVEARVRQNLDMAGNFLAVHAYSFNGHVYLVGLFRNKAEAQTALEAVRNTEGVNQITGVFQLQDTRVPFNPDTDLAAAVRLRDSLLESGALHTAKLRINVMQNKAVLVGQVGSPKEKANILAVARNSTYLAGMSDYLEVAP